MSVQITHNHQKFILTMQNSAYTLGVDSAGNVQHLYWGKRLPREADYPDCREIGQTVGIGKNLENPRDLSLSSFYYPYEAGRAVIDEEYPGWGGLNFVEPCLKVMFADGVRDLVLRYAGFTIRENGDLAITLRDTAYPLFVHLGYRCYEDVDILVRWAEIENRSGDVIWLESAQSAVWHAPRGQQYRLSFLEGRWGNEFNLQRELLPPGKRVLESRRGITSHHESPWFALDPEGRSIEHSGPVWFGTLAWSGNWQISLEYTANQQMRVTGGVNDFDFAWELTPGETFKTPESIAGYSEEGFGGASRQLHRYAIRHVSPQDWRGKPWPVFYNTWETFWFDIDEEKLLALAEKAAGLGVEVFHVDDGWFGARQNEYAGLGDWTVNRSKFPHGLGPLVERVHALGMEFSLWIEPENVNVDSDLYRAHPDWVYGFPTRSPTIQRESLILNLGKPEVRDYIWDSLSHLVREYQVRHFKWDLNRHMSEPGWTGLPAHKQKELWVRHVQGVYEILERMKREFPGVTLEACAGGGGRCDLGMLQYAEIALTSDNHDPLARLLIQEGYSHIFPAKTMGCWVTDTPSPLTRRSLPLPFMFHAAMTGALGIQTNLLAWDEAETEIARKMIELYKEVRPVIQEGDLYRLSSLRESHFHAVEYVSPHQDQAAVFVFMHTHPDRQAPITNILRWGSPRFICLLHLQGLIPDRLYRVGDENRLRSGEALRQVGIEVEFAGDGDSQLIRIQRIE